MNKGRTNEIFINDIPSAGNASVVGNPFSTGSSPQIQVLKFQA
jgi:hypothetical protein